jgi:hypothetical protein
MSQPVTADDVPARLEEYGTIAFLVTVGGDGSPKVVHVPVLWTAGSSATSPDGTSSQPAAGVFRCTPGGGTLRNLAQPGPVTLVFPPPEPGAYSMLIDGTGRVMDDESGTADLLEVSFRGGGLHRPAPAVPGDQARC